MWTSILLYRMALQYAEQYDYNKLNEEELPPYEASPPPPYTLMSPISTNSSEPAVS